jgi:antitoxin VapB
LEGQQASFRGRRGLGGARKPGVALAAFSALPMPPCGPCSPDRGSGHDQDHQTFTAGGSQAVLLPDEFRFGVDEVYVRRDEHTGDVILSIHPRSSWADFMAQREQLGPLQENFRTERQQGTEVRDPLHGWHE